MTPRPILRLPQGPLFYRPSAEEIAKSHAFERIERTLRARRKACRSGFYSFIPYAYIGGIGTKYGFLTLQNA